MSASMAELSAGNRQSASAPLSPTDNSDQPRSQNVTAENSKVTAGSTPSETGATQRERLQDTPTTGESLAALPTTAESLAQTPSTLDNILELNHETIPNGLTGSAQGVYAAGRNTTIGNPQLTIRYESTQSAWNGKGGFHPEARAYLDSKGFVVQSGVNPTPPGSVAKAPGRVSQQYTTHNGDLARDAIADRYRNLADTRVRTEVRFDANLREVPESATARPDLPGDRKVDVKVDIDNPADPRFKQTLEIESKATRVVPSNLNHPQIDHDAARLTRNRALRNAGFALEGVGKIARPVGLALDAVDVVSAYRADGNAIGRNTGESLSGLAGGAAGGWGGAVAGAAIGTAILPGVGTVVGGLIGAAAGAWGGDNLGRGAFATISGWFGG
ncbi:MAG: hypothetical protein ABW101_03665 [Candidatus Thiodiazotropha sp.]